MPCDVWQIEEAECEMVSQSFLWNFFHLFAVGEKTGRKKMNKKTEWKNFPVLRIKFAVLWSFLKLLFSFTLALFSPGVSPGMMKQNTKHKEGNAWNTQMYRVNSNHHHPRGFPCHIICECRAVGVNNYSTLFNFTETKCCHGRYYCFHSVLITRSQYDNLIING